MTERTKARPVDIEKEAERFVLAKPLDFTDRGWSDQARQFAKISERTAWKLVYGRAAVILEARDQDEKK